ncbi:MAG TPA: AMP-binding protein, partial [Anaerolineae bacterium]
MEQPWLAHYERSVPAHIDYPAVPLHNLLEESARDFPDRPAVSLLLRYLGPVRFGGRLTYRQLLPEVDRFAAALYAIGVRKGDRIALLLPNLPQFVIAFYGAARLGAVIVNNNPTYTAAELEHQFSDTGAETVILVSSLYARFKEFHAHTAIKRIIVTDIADYVPSPMKMLVENNLRRDGLMVDVPEVSGVYHWHRLLNAHPERPHRVDVRPDDPILLQFTGGTTGVPKAAVLTHRNVVANTIQSSYWLAKVERGHEQFLGAIPFFHVYGMTIAMSLSVYAAGELLIVPDPRQLDMVMRVIQREHVTVFPGVPAMYIGIINHPRVAKY